MQLTPEQVKGRIKNVAKENKADARTLMRIYMMERFLERVASSQYKDNFIIKGGMLVTAMVGVALRSTMDIDTSIKNQNLSAEDARRIVDEIKDIDLGDGVTFEVKEVSNIMDEMEYPGIRFTMNAVMGKLVTPMKIDISTGDVITPRAIEYNYKLLLDDRSISLWSYNLETILAEKLQTVLARGLLNTRMRDFYDIKTLLSIYEQDIDADVLKKAFEATCKKRSTENLKEEAPKIMAAVSDDAQLHTLWKSYQKKYPYAADMLTFSREMYAVNIKSGRVDGDVIHYRTIYGMEFTAFGARRTIKDFKDYRVYGKDGKPKFAENEAEILGEPVQVEYRKRRNGKKI